MLITSKMSNQGKSLYFFDSITQKTFKTFLELSASKMWSLLSPEWSFFKRHRLFTSSRLQEGVICFTGKFKLLLLFARLSSLRNIRPFKLDHLEDILYDEESITILKPKTVISRTTTNDGKDTINIISESLTNWLCATMQKEVTV